MQEEQATRQTPGYVIPLWGLERRDKSKGIKGDNDATLISSAETLTNS